MTAPAETGFFPASAVLKRVASRLQSGRPEGALDSPGRDARLLLALALDRQDTVLPHESITMTASAAARLDELVQRRIAGEPVSRMRGWREFYSLSFGLNPATLDPRPDSECIVDQALAWAGGNPSPGMKVLDFGTGTGCLLLAVLNAIPDAQGTGVDLAPEAVHQASVNAASLGLAARAEFVVSDWDRELEGRFRLILSNPPYIPQGDLAGLMTEVRCHDPHLALDGGDDGYDAWRNLLPAICRKLEPTGRAFVEIGAGQEEMVTALAMEAGLRHCGQARDLGGVIRCLEFELP